MHLIQHPNPTPGDLDVYSAKVRDDSFRRGDYTLYFDVFEDGDRLFSSYFAPEPATAWTSRNMEDNTTSASNPWIRGFDDLFRWPVPRITPSARTLSLSEVSLILTANLDIALRGREMDPSVVLPNANNLRQQIHYDKRPWSVRWVVDNTNGVILRAGIAHRTAESFDIPDVSGA